MIVKMKQVTLLTDSKRQETALLNLRKLGVLHPRLIMRPGSKELHVIETELDKVDKALSLLDEKCTEFAAEEKDETAIVNQIIEVSQEKEKLASELEKLVETRHWFERWGAVSYASLRKLQQNGIIIRFYVAEKSAFENLPADQITYPVKENQKMVYFIHITESPEERLNFKKEPMPEVELSILESEIRRLKNEIAVKSALIKKLSCARDLLERFRKNLEKQLEFYRVLLNMGVERGVAYLQGFCPVDKIPQLKKMAEEEYLGYLIEEPDNPAEVPTVLRNPKWVRIIQPLFDFMGTLPGYAEQDISLGFLVFFSIFYAMLVGDAGYGLIILLGTMFFARKNKKAPREPFRLMYLLGFTTVLWGLFSGTWFGSEKIAQFPVLQFFIIDSIYSFSETNQGLMMQITFIIGAVHLSLARILSALKKINSPVALAELGWVAILWGIYFVANHLVLGKPLPGFVAILFMAGVSLIAIFSHFQKNILKGILLSLSNLPLDIINTFSDVVSYIRLFAVGMATVIVASSFNEMALGAGINSVLSGLISVVVLLFGHALNIILALMSVLVHGVRLNMLEFSGHIGMQWSGKKYRPFRE